MLRIGREAIVDTQWAANGPNWVVALLESADAVLALEPAIAQDIINAVKARLADGVILASSDVRKYLKAMLEPELPNVAVIAAHELSTGTAVTTIGRIEVA